MSPTVQRLFLSPGRVCRRVSRHIRPGNPRGFRAIPFSRASPDSRYRLTRWPRGHALRLQRPTRGPRAANLSGRKEAAFAVLAATMTEPRIGRAQELIAADRLPADQKQAKDADRVIAQLCGR